MEIHERLKELRTENQYTRENVSQMLKVTDKQIYRWETNQAEMGIFKLKELCILYNVSADYILGLSNKKSRG